MPSFAELMDPFEAAAARTRQSVKPEGGRQEGLATKLLENYAPHVGRGLADLMTTPRRAYQQGLSPEEENDFAANTAMMMAGKTPFAKPGTVGVFGGRLSKTADQANLSLAEMMHEKGIDRRQIWDATGWFQDAGGLWRYRIPDTNLKVNQYAPNDTKALQQRMAGQEVTNMQGKGLSGGSNYIEHPEVEGAYPQFENMTHSIIQQPFTGHDLSSGAYFAPGLKPFPHIRIDAANPTQARSVAAHELSHAIDDIEGASVGSNPGVMRPLVDRVLGTEYPDFYGNPNTNWNSLAYESAMEAYRRFAGETRARAAQKELNMTPEELKNTPPWESEDIPREKQFVISPGNQYWKR